MTVEGVVNAANGRAIGTVDTMPSASSKLSGASVLYIGADGANYRTGTIYECTGSGSSWTWTAKGTVSDTAFTSALKTKLDGISDSADAVSFTASLTSGTKIGVITINGVETTLYSTNDTDNKVYQSAISDANEHCIMLKTSGTDNVNEGLRFATGVTVNPSAKTITATAFKGALTGNADTATKATQDASGNTITTTYATKTEMGGKLDKTAKAASASVADKATSDGAGNNIASTYVTNTALEAKGYALKSDLSSVYKPKGSVAGVSNLPTNASEGDVYNVEAEFTYNSKKYPAGTNVAWVAGSGSTAGYWDPLGGTVDLSSYQTKSVGTANRALVTNSSGNIAVSAVTSTELGYLDGVTSSIQTQLNGKQATITGAATTIDTENLTASRALVSSSSGKVAVSAVTATELGYLDGVTSNIQTQLNAKAASSAIPTDYVPNTRTVNGKALSSNISLTASDVGALASSSVLRAAGVSVTWASDTSVTGYSYKGTITLTGCTANHMPIVSFAAAQARSGSYSSYAESGAGVVYIWAKTNTVITVDVVAVLN